MGHLGGQIIFAHVGVIAILVMIGRLSLPESPVWIKAHDERQHGVHTERAEHARLLDLLKKPYVIPFVCLLVFYPLVNLAANTGGQFGTYLWVNTAGTSVEFAARVGLVMVVVGLVLSLVFLRVVDTKFRMPAFYVGAACYLLSTLVPALLGVSVSTLLVWQCLGAIGGAFAFEAILKVWTQESFPTLLRSTAQGTIIAVARVLAAILALVTPRLAAAGPQGLFAVLTVLIGIGMAAAIFGFRKGSRNEFDIEGEEVEAGGYARRRLCTDRDLPSLSLSELTPSAQKETMLDNASMITAGTDRDAAVLLGTTITLDRPATTVRSAVLSATAHGVYEASIERRPVTDSVLNPGWTAYEWRLQVQRFDVAGLITGADGNRST